MSVPAVTTDPGTGFSSADFRAALGSFATGVTVITTTRGSQHYGMTANAFSSLSLDPPLVLVCAISGSTGSEEIEQNGVFAVNILAVDQEPMSRFFSSRDRPKGRDAFRDVPHTIGASGAPLIDGAAAHLDCRLERSYTVGDHDIFIGEVLHLTVNKEAEPLIFHAGRYRLVTDAS